MDRMKLSSWEHTLGPRTWGHRMLTWGQGPDSVIAACATALIYTVFVASSPCIHSYSAVVQVSNKSVGSTSESTYLVEGIFGTTSRQ